MNNKYTINLNNLIHLKDFHSEISKNISSEVDAIYEKQIIDAKSLLGLLSISVHNIEVKIHSDDTRELETFKQICERYEVK